MKQKLVTIGVPVYNGARFLEETLRSILAQSYAEMEILISDNASTDATPEIIKKFSDSRIVYHRSEATIPGEENWNLLLQKASGDYVALFHADDVYSPHMVGSEVRFLEAHPEALAVLTLMDLIDDKGKLIGKTSLPKELPGNAPLHLSEIFHALMRHGNVFLGCPTAMARHSAYEAVGSFDYKNYGTSADLGMWLSIAERGPIGVLSERLIQYRVHTTSGGSRYQATRTTTADFFKVMDRYLNSSALEIRPGDAELRQYAFHRQRDNLRRAINLLSMGREREARDLLSLPGPRQAFRACLENRRVAQGLFLSLFLGVALRLGAGSLAGRALHRWVYGAL